MIDTQNLPQITRCVSRAIEEMYGETTKQDIWNICMNHDLGVTEEQIKGALIYSEIESQFRSRSREKQSKKNKQNALFGDGYLDSLMVIGDRACKVRHATWAWHREKRENQILAMRKANARFEKDEERREQLAELMEHDSTLTTEQALIELGIYGNTAEG